MKYASYKGAFQLLILIACLLFNIVSKGQSKDSTSLSNRVKNLEDYRNNLESIYNLKLAKLDSSIDARIAAKVEDINEAKKTLNLIIWIGIPGTIIGMIVVFITATTKAKKFVIDKIAKIVEDKREEIIKLIETQEYDSKLRRNKKLLVLSPDEESQDSIKKLLNQFNFSSIEFRIVIEYKEYENYDLLIFNDNYTNFSEELMNEFMNDSQDYISFVAYTKNRLTPHTQLNFSNSPYTLYHSILSTLKYSEILKLKETNNL